jgi:hypothetical protein
MRINLDLITLQITAAMAAKLSSLWILNGRTVGQVVWIIRDDPKIFEMQCEVKQQSPTKETRYK